MNSRCRETVLERMKEGIETDLRINFELLSNINIRGLHGAWDKKWDDEDLEEIHKEEIIYLNGSTEEAVSAAKIIIKALVNGRSPEHPLPGLLTMVISQMTSPKTTNKFIFLSHLKRGTKQFDFTVPPSQDTVINLDDQKIKVVTEKTKKISKNQRPTPAISDDEKMRLYDSILTLLDDPTKTSSLQKFINVVGMICLILLRLMAKSGESVHKYFKQRFSVVLDNIYGYNLKGTCLPVSKEFLESLEGELNKSLTDVAHLFRQIILCYNAAATCSPQDQLTIGVLKAGVLLHLEYNGLQVVKTIGAVCAEFGCSLADFIRKTLFEAYYESWKVLVPILSKHFKNKGISCFPWCRLIDDTYHPELSSKYHKNLLSMLFFILREVDPTNHKNIFDAYPFNGKISFSRSEECLFSVIISELTATKLTSMTKITDG